MIISITIFLTTILMGIATFWAIGRQIQKNQKRKEERMRQELALTDTGSNKKGKNSRKVPIKLQTIHEAYPLVFEKFHWQFQREKKYYILHQAGKKLLNIGIAKEEEYPATFQNKENQRETTKLEYQPKIILKKERGIDVSAKEIGLVKEFQTGERLFDEAVFIATDAPDPFLRYLFESSTLRHAILRLFKNHNAKQVSLFFKGTPLAVKFRNAPTILESREGIDAVLDCINEVYDALPSITVQKAGRVQLRIGQLAIALATLYCMAASFFAMIGLEHWQVFREDFLSDALTTGIGVSVFTVAILFFFIRGNSQALPHFGTSSLYVTIGILISSSVSLRYVNATFDSSTPQVITVPIAERRVDKNDDGNNYYITVKESPQTPTQEFRVRKKKYQALENTKMVKLHVGEGYLSEQWLVKMEFDED